MLASGGLLPDRQGVRDGLRIWVAEISVRPKAQVAQVGAPVRHALRMPQNMRVDPQDRAPRLQDFNNAATGDAT